MTEIRDWRVEISVLAEQLVNSYLDQSVARQIADLLLRRLADGEYSALATEEQLAPAVTSDMQSINGDKHLYLSYTSKLLSQRDDPVLPDTGRDHRLAGLNGHGFARVERLPGNIGLLDIRRFYPPTYSGSAATAVMNLVADADALIIDLRENTGGEPEMVALLHSYLVDEQTKLNSVFFPAEDRTIQFWTLPYVPGSRYGGEKPIYVLIGPATFSGGEGFSYDLQQYGRAVLIGEPTSGAANFHIPMRVADHLLSAIPTGYPVQAVSMKNWEGTGVTPDIASPAEQAFNEAYRLALAHVLSLGDEPPREQVARDARASLDALRAGC